MLFEDTTLGEKRRAAILADLQGLLGQPTHHMTYYGGGRQRFVPYHETWRRSLRQSPRLVTVEGAECLLIEAAISRAYEEVFKRLEQHPKALPQLADFIDYMDHIEQREWRGWDQLVYPFFASPGSEDEWEELKQRGKDHLIRQLRDDDRLWEARLSLPSVLAISRPEELIKAGVAPRGGETAPALLADLHWIDGKGHYETDWPFVYHEGHWKMLLPFGGE